MPQGLSRIKSNSTGTFDHEGRKRNKIRLFANAVFSGDGYHYPAYYHPFSFLASSFPGWWWCPSPAVVPWIVSKTLTRTLETNNHLHSLTPRMTPDCESSAHNLKRAACPCFPLHCDRTVLKGEYWQTFQTQPWHKKTDHAFDQMQDCTLAINLLMINTNTLTFPVSAEGNSDSNLLLSPNL